ncbi:hypothetical protein ACCZ63_19025, partial [Candidatus Pantoea formicae]
MSVKHVVITQSGAAQGLAVQVIAQSGAAQGLAVKAITQSGAAQGLSVQVITQSGAAQGLAVLAPLTRCLHFTRQPDGPAQTGLSLSRLHLSPA